jgi:hypothetical protein
MTEGLKEFLKDREEQEYIWLLLPSGMIVGKITKTPEWTDRDRVTLTDVQINTRTQEVEVDEATILLSQVHAWGAGLPVVIYDYEDGGQLE